MSKILDRYAGAVNSGNLASKEATVYSDSDVLGAAGLAGKRNALAMALAAGFAAELERTGAENYIELTFDHDKHGPLLVTVQRKRGKTPAQVAAELRRELAELRKTQSSSRSERDQMKTIILFLAWPLIAAALLALSAITFTVIWPVLLLGRIEKDGDSPEPLWRWLWD